MSLVEVSQGDGRLPAEVRLGPGRYQESAGCRGGTRVSDQDTIRIKCPNLSCQRILAVPCSARGKLVRCRVCGFTLRVPQKAAAEPAESSKNKAG